MFSTITTTGFDAINTIDVQLPSDLPLAGIPARDQLARLTMPARTQDAAQAKARALVSNDIDSYSAATLDAIANALRKPKQSGDDEFYELVRDIERHLQTGLTLLDYDEELRYCQYEQVWGECYKADNAPDFPYLSATWEAPQSRAAAKRRQQTQQRQSAAQAAATSVTNRLASVTRNSRTASDGRSRPQLGETV